MEAIRENKQFLIFAGLCLLMALGCANNLLTARTTLANRDRANASAEASIQTLLGMLGADPSHTAALRAQQKDVENRSNDLRATLSFDNLNKYSDRTTADSYALIFPAVDDVIAKSANKTGVVFSKYTAMRYDKNPRDLAQAVKQLAVLEQAALLASDARVSQIVECSTVSVPKRYPTGSAGLATPVAVKIVVRGSLSSLMDLLSRCRQPGKFLGINDCKISPESSSKEPMKPDDLEMTLELYALDIPAWDAPVAAAAPEPATPGSTQELPLSQPRAR